MQLMILTLKPRHVMMYPNWRPPINLQRAFLLPKNIILLFLMGSFYMGLVRAEWACSLRWLVAIALIPVEKPLFYYPKIRRPTMLQQAIGHVLPQNYGIEVERISVGQKNFTIMGQVRVIFFEDANGELQAMIKFDQHSPELLKREGLVFAHFALAEMVEV